MSHENVELVEAAFGAWNRGREEGFGRYVAEQIEWVEVSGRPEVEGAVVRGRESVLAGLRSLFDSWEEYLLEPERFEDLDDRVLAIFREVGRGRRSGLEVRGRWAYVVTPRAGKIWRVEAYRDPDDALEAVGLQG